MGLLIRQAASPMLRAAKLVSYDAAVAAGREAEARDEVLPAWRSGPPPPRTSIGKPKRSGGDRQEHFFSRVQPMKGKRFTDALA